MRNRNLARRGLRAAAVALLLSLPLYACVRVGPPAPYLAGQSAMPEAAAAPQAASMPAEITVGRGESLYGIARAYHVSPGALIAANHLRPPYRVEAGWTLVIPQSGAPPPTRQLAVATRRVPSPLPPAAPPPAAATSPPLPRPKPSFAAPPPRAPAEEPAAATAKREVAAHSPPPASPSPDLAPAAAPAATPPAAASSPPPPAANPHGGFLWPVRGHILAGYGVGADGTHNDGINIAAPRGAPVQSTAPGVVVYAGNELRGYGNLILVKHAGGFISAYAHCDMILVKRGQQVGRGQTIARVGSTGNVSAPQLHFELRRGDKPVDPRSFLAPLSTATGRGGNSSG